MLSAEANEFFFFFKFGHSSDYIAKLLKTTDLTHFFIKEFSLAKLTEFARFCFQAK